MRGIVSAPLHISSDPHANISQTDTYLNAGSMELQHSMRRFDASRGKPVANESPIEHRPSGHEKTEPLFKVLLH
jgi:hypothetical protein